MTADKPTDAGQQPEATTTTRYVDVTPTWAAILPVLLHVIKNGSVEGRRMATEELQRMAEAADLYNASVAP